MGTTIHQLRGIVTSDIKGFVLGMDAAGASTRKLVNEWKNAASAIWSASQRVLMAVGAMTAGVTKSFADFEDAMIEVGAITRTLGTRDFDLLKKAALEMGEETRYTAVQAAGGLKELSLAGLDAQQSISALRPTLQLATSAGIGIGQAASISAKLMKGMGLEARDLSHVNDVLVSTFQRSNTDLVMLSEGMKHAGPVAHALGVSLEDVTAILAKLSDAGFQGEMGGTALRNIMSRLAGAMPRMTKQFEELGIETMNANGSMRPLVDVLADIEAKGLSAGKVMELFGQRGGPQLLALLEQGIGGIRKFSAETKAAAGAASAVEKARVNTIKGQWDELTSYIEGLFLSAGERIAPQVRQLIDDVEQFFRANQPEILQEMTQAATGLIQGLQSLSRWLMDNRHAMWEVLQTFGGFLRWIAEFLAAHPQLMAAMAALKVTGILGLNTAVVALGKALVVTLQELIRFMAASQAAGTAGKVAAAGIAAAFNPATLAVTGLVAAVATVGGAFYAMRVTAETQLRRLEKSLDELAAKNLNIFGDASRAKLREIANNDNPAARLQGFADEAGRRQQRVNAQVKFLQQAEPGSPEENRARETLRKMNDEMNNAFDALASELTQQFKSKIEQAKDVNPGAADAVIAQIKQIQDSFKGGGITAAEFAGKLESLDLELAKIARNLDPQVEALRETMEKLPDFIESGNFAKTDKFLADLNSVQNQLGGTFQDIVNQVAFLNQQLAQGVITQEQYAAQIRELNKAVQVPAQEKNTALIEGRIKDAKLQAEKDKFSEFETIQGLVGQTPEGDWNTGNLNAAGVAAIGKSVEGATPEIIGNLVDGFTKLQLQGEEAVREGFDELILSFLKAVDEAKTEAEKQRELNATANEAYKRGGTASDVAKYGSATGEGMDNPLSAAFIANQKAAYGGTISEQAYKDRNDSLGNVAGQSTAMLEELKKSEQALNALKRSGESFGRTADDFRIRIQSLTEQFAAGKIDEDQFTEKMKELRASLDQATEAGSRAVAMEQQYAKIMALKQGNLQGAGVNLQQMIMDKVLSYQMGQIDQWVNWYVSQILGLGTATQNLSQGFSNFSDSMDHYTSQAGAWYEDKFGQSGQVTTTWNNFVNSIMGQVALLNNQIEQMAQGLQLTNITMSKKLEIQRQIDELIRQRDALLVQPPPTFIGTSYDPFFTDPGVGQGGSSSTTINYTFPNVNKFTSADVSRLNDALIEDKKRRGLKV